MTSITENHGNIENEIKTPHCRLLRSNIAVLKGGLHQFLQEIVSWRRKLNNKHVLRENTGQQNDGPHIWQM